MQSFLTWMGRKVDWSPSRQFWQEQAGMLVFLTGLGSTLWFGRYLPGAWQAGLWGLLVLVAAILARRGWLVIFGPVLFYDLVRTARRGRYFVLRCFYAALLLFFLFTTYMNTDYHHLDPAQRAARFAENYFNTFMMVQFMAAALLTPAYVAGSVAEEKDKKTLDYLLATDLRNREIILSKLGARLANLVLLFLTGLPIFSLIQFLGGVDPNLVLAGFAATGLTMAGLAGLSILFSVSFQKPRDAIVMTYLAAFTYLVLSGLAAAGQGARLGILSQPIWFGAGAATIDDLVTGFNSGNVFLNLDQIAAAGRHGTLATEVPVLLGDYFLFQGAVFLACTTWAVVRLRRIALRQSGSKPRKGFSAGRRRRRPIGEQPMIWKELFIEAGVGFKGPARVILPLLLLASLVPGLQIFWQWLNDTSRVRIFDIFGGGAYALKMNVYVRLAGTGVACLLLLGVAVRAATSIGGERDRQTLDALLTTPLDSVAILKAKWLGSLWSVRLGWIWLGLIWGLGVMMGGLSILALPLLAGAWIVYAGVVAAVGLWFSLVSRPTLRAILGTLFTTLGLFIGHWLVCVPLCYMPATGMGDSALLKIHTGLTPPAVLAIFAFPHSLNREFGDDSMKEFAVFCLFGLMIWGLAGVWFWNVVLVPRFRRLTGRQDFRGPEVRQSSFLEVSPSEPAKPRPPLEPKNAILIDEAWEKPDKKSDGQGGGQ